MYKTLVQLTSLLIFLNLATPTYSQQLQSARPWMGVSIEDHVKGVLILQTLSGTPAEKAGLKEGDVITKIDSTIMKSAAQLIETVGNLGVGNNVKVTVLRDKSVKVFSLKLVPRPDSLALLKDRFLGKKAPTVELVDLKSAKKVNFPDSIKGVKIIEFWATWCPACNHSFKVIEKQADDLAKKGVTFLSSSDEDEKTLKGHFPSGYPSFGMYRDALNKASKEYMVTALPTLFVVDEKGVVRYVAIGAGEYLDEALAKAKELAKK